MKIYTNRETKLKLKENVSAARLEVYLLIPLNPSIYGFLFYCSSLYLQFKPASGCAYTDFSDYSIYCLCVHLCKYSNAAENKCN